MVTHSAAPRRTYEAVVLAADSLRVASGATADTDDTDGRAVEAEQDVDVLDDDTDGAEGSGTSGGASLL